MRSRAEHAADLMPEIRAVLAGRTALEWEELFGERVPCAAVRPIEDMFDHPQVAAEGLVTRLQHPVVGPLPHDDQADQIRGYAGARSRPRRRPSASTPSEVLARYGYSETEIAALRDRGAVK